MVNLLSCVLYDKINPPHISETGTSACFTFLLAKMTETIDDHLIVAALCETWVTVQEFHSFWNISVIQILFILLMGLHAYYSPPGEHSLLTKQHFPLLWLDHLKLTHYHFSAQQILPHRSVEIPDHYWMTSQFTNCPFIIRESLVQFYYWKRKMWLTLWPRWVFFTVLYCSFLNDLSKKKNSLIINKYKYNR